MMNRRQFGKVAGTTALGGGLVMTTMNFSCGSVFADITSYIPIGIAAFNEVLTLLDPAEATLLAPIIADVKNGFADLAAAVSQYENAPAADKATLIGKITTIINAVMTALQTFWSQANLPDGNLANTIEGILQIILSTLAAFLPLVGGTPSMEKLKGLKRTVKYTPQKRTQKQFKSDVNAVFQKYGYGTHVIY